MTPVRGTPRLEKPHGPVSRGAFSRLGTAWLGTAWDSWHRVGLAGEPSRWVVTNAHSFDAAWHRAGSPSPQKVRARPENLAAGTPIASRKRSESVEPTL